jgi:protein gp37
MIDSKIQWCDDTVNVVEGCEQVDTDCRSCYAMGMAARFAQDQVTARRESDGAPMETKPGHYAGLARLSPGRRLPQWTGEVRLCPDVLDKMFWRLLRAREPRRQFLCSMGDIFHREVPDAFLDEVFARIAILESRRAPVASFLGDQRDHPIYMLTKRPERAAAYTNAPDVEERIERAARAFIERARGTLSPHQAAFIAPRKGTVGQLCGFTMPAWPLRSVVLITSAGTQEGAEARVPWLLRCKAAMRGVSCEPMTGPVSFARWLGSGLLRWMILGGESGEDARPCELHWMDVVAEDCRRAGVPLFVKQLGHDLARRLGRDGKGGKLEDLPEHLRIRQFPRILERTST